MGGDIDAEAAGDNFGFSISLCSDGSVLAIGANQNNGNGIGSGHVRVYEYDGTEWSQIGNDIDGGTAGDNFGYSPSINSDGSVLAIGAIETRGDGVGYVRVYKNFMGSWVQIGSDIDGEGAFDNFGYSTNLSSNGNVLAVGAYQNDGVNGNDSGHVRVYQYDGAEWSQIGNDIDGEAAGDELGWSVSLSTDGSIVAIGAALNNGNGNNSGHIRVYENPILGIQENTFGANFSIYPNPSLGVSTIQLGENYHTVNVNVFNTLGKQVASQTHHNRTVVKLNTQEYSSGIYIIKIKSRAKKAIIKLLVE